MTASEIVVRFGGLIAINSVSIEAPPGRITGLIGPNGAGKTTMFNVCCGFQSIDHGRVSLDGADITHLTPTRRARLGIGRTFQRMELFGSLTVRQNIALAAESLHIHDDPLTQLGIVGTGRRVRNAIADTTEELIEALDLRDAADQLAGEISTGQGRLVEMARALARSPRILLLDEPTSGLDVAESARFGQLLLKLVQHRGIAVFLIEHDMSVVLNVCDFIYVMDFGRYVMSGTPGEIRTSEEVRRVYLGQASDVA